MSARVTTEPEFYDHAMTDAHEPAMLPLELSPWRSIYAAAANLISFAPLPPVVDLGCGTGRFAELLRRRGFAFYHGFDFSPAAVLEASSYTGRDGWRMAFEVVDLREWEPGEPAAGTAYTILEVLEHLEDDVDLIRRIPVGHKVVFSVPNYGGEAHLRTFSGPGVAHARYGHLLAFDSWHLLGSGPEHVHIYRATRRGDTW